MPSSYPDSLDAFTDPLSTSALNSPSHSQLHSDVNDAIEKIEAYVPRRNFLYNGAMQVHQRGTSTTGITTSGYYTADRWQYAISSAGTWTQTVENDAPTGSGFRKSVKLTCTTADASPASGDLAIFAQSLEGQDVQPLRKGTSSAQQVTVTFWVKANVTGTYICDIFDAVNTRGVSRSYTITASNTWEFKTLTFPGDTVGALPNDNLQALQFRWWLVAGSAYQSGSLQTSWAASSSSVAVGQVNVASAINNYWQVTGVQVNLGAVAAPFEFKNYGKELAECQRYFTMFNTNAASAGYIGSGVIIGTGAGYVYVNLPTTMRAAPDQVVTAGTLGYGDDYAAGGTVSAIAYVANRSTNQLAAFQVTLTTTPLTAGRTGYLYASGTTGRLGIGAEL